MPRRLPIHIPQTADELTTGWLTEALRGSASDVGVPDAEVVAFKTGEPGAGVGFSGLTVRVDLTWEPADPALPETVLAKFPTDIANNRGLVESEGTYDREFDFYERFSEGFPTRIPRLLYAVRDPGRAWSSMDRQFRILNRVPDWIARLIGRYSHKMVRPTKRRFAMLLEYVDGARVTPLDEIPPEADLQAILGAQALFHAHWWWSPVLHDEAPFAWRTCSQVPHILNGGYAVHRDPVVAQYPQYLTPSVMRFADWVDANLTAVVDHLNDKMAFLHGDARSDNMLFTGSDSGEASGGGLVLIDFGMVSSGRPAWDVGYLLSSTIPPGPSARSELVRLSADYHARLVAAGVTDHPLEQFHNDVDLCLCVQIHRMILTAAIFVGEGYGDATLAELWMQKIIDQLPEEFPVVGQVD
tara:strand:- start:4910 stop:6148 length:1239 start_codon:yes stop_codon:yes gene_type:complete